MPALVGYNTVAASVFLMRKRSIVSHSVIQRPRTKAAMRWNMASNPCPSYICNCGGVSLAVPCSIQLYLQLWWCVAGWGDLHDSAYHFPFPSTSVGSLAIIGPQLSFKTHTLAGILAVCLDGMVFGLGVVGL